MLCHAREFLTGTNGSWKVRRKWKTTNVQDKPSTSKTEVNVRKISEIVWKNQHLSI
jgi:hypothetical protein